MYPHSLKQVERMMSQLSFERLMREPTETWEYVVLSVVIFCFGLFFAWIGRILLGKSPADAMFSESLAIKEHRMFGSAVKLGIYTLGQDYLCWYWLLGKSAELLQGWQVVAIAIPISILFMFLPPHTSVKKNKKKVLAAIAIGGFILALLYLKCGGWSGQSAKGILICNIAHLWTTSLLANAYRRSQRQA